MTPLTYSTNVIDESMQERAARWAGTMSGHSKNEGIVLAHLDSWAGPGSTNTVDRRRLEEYEDSILSPLATRARGGGDRLVEEESDPWRTCFERDRDRILHSSSFRRLAGKTQVFVFPDDHQRTRLTHALEVAQVAVSIARPLGLNTTLTETIALGHDCGHGPGGHASEDALAPYVEGGFEHSTWGSDVTLAPLNLCAQTLDGIRNHSWSRPAPATPEGEVVSWADRIAYVCHDFEDAVDSRIVSIDDLPIEIHAATGRTRREQLSTFIVSMIRATADTGRIGMEPKVAEALARFRQFNYERVYLRPESRRQAQQVIDLLRALVDLYCDEPWHLPSGSNLTPGDALSRRAAVEYVAGMTDRFACRQATLRLGWSDERLPRGIDI